MFPAPFLLAAAGFNLMSFATAENSSSITPLYTVPVSDITTAEAEEYCTAQMNSCLEICDEKTTQNSCDSTTLAWACTCSDFTTPNISSYSQTIPYFLCEAYIAECQLDNTDDAAAQLACSGIDCGPNNPVSQLASYSASAASAATATSSASSASATATSASTTASTTAASAASSTSASATAASSAGAGMSFGQTYGNGILGAGLLAAFGLAL